LPDSSIPIPTMRPDGMEQTMKPFLIKLGILLSIWYEVSAELHMTGNTTLAVTLLACGAGMMYPQLADRFLRWPRVVLIALPAAVWFGLAWWLTPRIVGEFPVLTLMLGALLTLAGGGMCYVMARHGVSIVLREGAVQYVLVPVACLLLAVAG